jgi:hypothetical protein
MAEVDRRGFMRLLRRDKGTDESEVEATEKPLDEEYQQLADLTKSLLADVEAEAIRPTRRPSPGPTSSGSRPRVRSWPPSGGPATFRSPNLSLKHRASQRRLRVPSSPGGGNCRGLRCSTSCATNVARLTGFVRQSPSYGGGS